MFEAESFRKHYRLTPGRERLLEAVITRGEKVLILDVAIADRLKEQAAEAGMQLLVATTLDNEIIKIYFLAQDGIYIKAIELQGNNPNQVIFLNLLIYKFSQGNQPN